ncbi:hypothetical protein CC77DRAFT_1022266 [Alternaria alternata]|uniref:Elongation factor 1 alpha-like protein n=1 Tax=Alternaria alternata TaxID=5599 RepID=A0A177DIR9_ALTAL|nr:hypothetical protein CC77DRAFT_1022266 [Alternaria alternata]OAG18739.1 hypothetical protein CC77DRAFT_1022266 [Alternaria alternata]
MPAGGFSRTRNVDYDDDDIYDDDDYFEDDAGDVDAGGDGMTEDDKEQMRVGTVKVREALGDMSDFTSDEQIQEALWHYYYDIGKSVSYLKNKLGVAEPKQEAPKQEKAKPVSRFDQAASVADQNAPATTGTTPKKKKKQINGDLAESVEKLTVADEPRVKSKNLNVVDEFEKSASKRMANFVVLGHVDHGKSTLMGRLLYDLHVVDQRSIDKLRKEAETIGKSSFALAWVMDETSEERSRGVTVDIATNYFETDRSVFTILDAPGHKDFIPRMISGASQADFPVLVIDASTNSFESGLKGQTKEHILIARSMGMQHIVVAVNKMDTVGWSKSRFDEISKLMTTFLTEASFLEKRITFIPLAGLTGENVVKKIENSAAHWYTGETLLEALERIDLPTRNLTKPLRLSVADVFRGDIRSPLSISGRIDAGTLQVGDVILALPANETATIKSIEVQDAPVDWAVCGQIPTLHLTDIDPVHLRQGDIVCSPKDPVKLVKAFTSKLLAFEHVLPMPVEVFRSTLNSPAGIRTLSAKLNKFTGEVVKKKPRIVKPGEVARVVVQLEKELPVEEGMRVVLRERGRTVGAGLMENVA